MPIIDISQTASGLSAEDRALLETYSDEAKFFSRFLQPLLEEKKPNRVLEVGSGVGLLSLYASSMVPSMTALEPESSGFSRMSILRRALVELWSEPSLPEFKTSVLQELPKNENFDFIFCIHVLEHVPEPENLIYEIYSRLNPGGVAWFVQPNYGFPYEQHFEVPILFNKSLTGRVFWEKIRNHSIIPNPEGLWSELSWPTQNGFENFLQSTGWNYEFRDIVLRGYLNRLYEPQFLARKGFIYKLIRPVVWAIKPLILSLPHRIKPVCEFTISKPEMVNQKPKSSP